MRNRYTFVGYIFKDTPSFNLFDRFLSAFCVPATLTWRKVVRHVATIFARPGIFALDRGNPNRWNE